MDFYRLPVGGDIRTGDIRSARHPLRPLQIPVARTSCRRSCRRRRVIAWQKVRRACSWCCALPSLGAMNVAAKALRQQRGRNRAVDSLPEAAALLRWYDRHRRVLPWRAAPGKRGDPYRVWLSEIMLQQTTVKAVGPYYARFLARWPDVRALATAPLEEVLKSWAGLGYYARARNLHACARAVIERHDGKFPDSEAELRALPGIGAYTAAAIAAIAFDARTSPVDGNIERVIARLYAIDTPLPAAKLEIFHLASALTPPRRAGDFAQAMMDLGATICSPKRPACALCPWKDGGAGQRRGD